MEMGSVHSEREKWIMHYSSSHKILLVGEGDFSFAACLGRTFGSASNIVATSLDSREKLLRNYSKAGDHLQQLEDLGCTIIHGVDANTMSRHPLLEHKLFDKIVFNFPHAGLRFLSREWQARQIELHRKLMRGFFGNAGDMLVEDGEVHVTHKTSHPYTSWKIEELAEDNGGLYLVDEASFSILDYPGYENKRGYGKKINGTFPVGQCSTFIFRKKKVHLDWKERVFLL